MRKITMLFVSFLAALFVLFIGDAIDKSEDIIKTNTNVPEQVTKAAKTAEQYLTIGEVITAGGALVTGIFVFTTRNKS